MGETDATNLSGLWLGLFSYPRKLRPVHFEASLRDADGWLVGTTCETGTAGEVAGLTIGATLQGRRTERTVTFLKIYDGESRRYDSVHYEGAVSVDGTEIEGRWTVPGSWSGTFLMVRSAGPSTKVAVDAFARA
ncbi:MAG TPA: hypothetical protein VGG99_20790 [Acetobacteraceae bacterium]|jgi:hypothetical protein